MGDMLVAGNVGLLGREVVARLAQDYRLVVAHTPQQAASACVADDKTHAYEVASDPEALSRLFDIYSFDTVVYVSGFADAGTGLSGEQDLLVDVTRSACVASVSKFIYLTGLEYAPDARDERMQARGVAPAVFGRAFGAKWVPHGTFCPHRAQGTGLLAF